MGEVRSEAIQVCGSAGALALPVISPSLPAALPGTRDGSADTYALLLYGAGGTSGGCAGNAGTGLGAAGAAAVSDAPGAAGAAAVGTGGTSVLGGSVG
jgi:hypothetical protein